ncbi:MAG: beta-ketoacyl-ACP synthase II [candidate division KSB1 bacterium]|nr:beta-ketoacyl-ACP synthase II [candidate division KSB1 bacterium]MDZ7303256.1 beta-ketoacyl-ACP synthase II [candidate division KSB1 bacterium]MDZ7312560.1 beta-ketoacyl-ACP synthase II [candidate division KSB1 bacterium]
MQKTSTREGIVITGIGLVTPLGLTIEENWRALMEGRSGIDHIQRFDASSLPVRFAGEVRHFDPNNYMDAKEARHYDRYTHFAVAAADAALADAGLKPTDLPAEKTGIIVGSGMGGLATFMENARHLIAKGPRRVSPFFVPATITNIAAGFLAIRYGTRGVNYATVSACATGAHAIMDGLFMLRQCLMEVMIVGGSEAAIIDIGIAAFAAAKALSRNNDHPKTASRPFDLARDGFVIGEGAGILVLERKDRALARGARIWAEVCGAGASSDAFHITTPPEDGKGAALAMKMALADAGLKPEDIGYINAHATSTPLGDKAEAAAVQSVFGEHVHHVAVSSTKSMTGHLLGAAGAVEAAYTAMALYYQMLPPTINLENPDPECHLDHVANQSRPASIRYALSNGFGFGGTNAVLALGRHEQ